MVKLEPIVYVYVAAVLAGAAEALSDPSCQSTYLSVSVSVGSFDAKTAKYLGN